MSFYKLEVNEILIFGSDGKDDLISGLDEKTGKEIRNIDENNFLKIVEESRGSLEEIYKKLSGKWMIQDDLSLIHIHYKNIFNKNEKLFFDLNYEKKKLVELKGELNFEKYISTINRIVLDFPEQREYLLECSIFMIENNLHKYGLEFGERFRVLEPDNLDNLVNLILCYIELGQRNLAWDLFDTLESYSLGEKMKRLEAMLRG